VTGVTLQFLTRDNLLTLAKSVASEPTVGDALRQLHSSATLKALADSVRRETGTDFIVIPLVFLCSRT
jgi:sensor histidine kinase regulating citrate/malate metabolism